MGDETLEPLYALINVLVGFVGNYSLFLLVTPTCLFCTLIIGSV